MPLRICSTFVFPFHPILKINTTSINELQISPKYEPFIGAHVNVAGFPNYQIGDTLYFTGQRIASIRPASGYRRPLVDGPIAAGMSGGPVVDSEGKVIGVVVSGAETLSQANMTERHGFIPIKTVIDFLNSVNLSPVPQ